MSRFRTVEQAFQQIEKRSEDNGKAFGDILELESWLEDQLMQTKDVFHFMSNQTIRHADSNMIQDYLDWQMAKLGQQIRAFKTVPTPSAQDFWNAAHDFDPLGPNSPGSGSALQSILTSSHMEPIPIGKVYGRTMLKLLPVMGALPAVEIPGLRTPFGFAATDSAAISYPDGHPSEDEVASQ
ncbi:MAG: hypothetical protein Q9166_008211 [cf. Caloplaca sp. 2 TL-2023]